MIGVLILVISILLQFVAAVLAVRLIRITGKRLAWSLIAAAVVLMAVRRSVSLFAYFGSGQAKPPDVVAESIALVISGLMLIGIARIAPLFIERKRAEEALREQERYAQSLLRLSRGLERAQTYDEALNAARDEVKTIIGYQHLWAYIFTDDKKYAKMLVARGPIVGKLEKFKSEKDTFLTLTIQGDRMLEEIAEAKDIVVVENALADERTDKKIVAMLGNRTIINVPIFLMDKQLGSMGTGTFDEEGFRVPTKSERDYLVSLASHMAVTLDRIHLLTKRIEAEEELKKHREHLEELVRERTAELETKNVELEKFNKFFVGRELRMIELKKIIEENEKRMSELEKEILDLRRSPVNP